MNAKCTAGILGSVMLSIAQTSNGAVTFPEQIVIADDYGVTVSKTVGTQLCESAMSTTRVIKRAKAAEPHVRPPRLTLSEIPASGGLRPDWTPPDVMVPDLPMGASWSARSTSSSRSSSTMGEITYDSDSDSTTSVGDIVIDSTYRHESLVHDLYGEIYSPTAVELFWETNGEVSLTDNTAWLDQVNTYDVYRDGKLIMRTRVNNFYDISLRESSLYNYEICATAGLSSWSLGHILVHTPPLY